MGHQIPLIVILLKMRQDLLPLNPLVLNLRELTKERENLFKPENSRPTLSNRESKKQPSKAPLLS